MNSERLTSTINALS